MTKKSNRWKWALGAVVVLVPVLLVVWWLRRIDSPECVETAEELARWTGEVFEAGRSLSAFEHGSLLTLDLPEHPPSTYLSVELGDELHFTTRHGAWAIPWPKGSPTAEAIDEQFAVLLEDVSEALGVYVSETTPWSRVAWTMAELGKRGVERLEVWFVKPRPLKRPPKPDLWRFPFSLLMTNQFDPVPKLFPRCTTTGFLAPFAFWGAVTTPNDWQADENESLRRSLQRDLPRCGCLQSERVIRQFVWLRYGPDRLAFAFRKEAVTTAAQFRPYVGAVVRLVRTDGVPLEFAPDATWREVAADFVRAVAAAGDRPVQPGLKVSEPGR